MSDELTYWVLKFHDAHKADEVFTDEAAARERYEQASLSWTCRLFVKAHAFAAQRATMARLEEEIQSLREIVGQFWRRCGRWKVKYRKPMCP